MSTWSEALDPDRWLADHPLPPTELFPEIRYTVQRYHNQLARRGVTCSYDPEATAIVEAEYKSLRWFILGWLRMTPMIPEELKDCL